MAEGRSEEVGPERELNTPEGLVLWTLEQLLPEASPKTEDGKRREKELKDSIERAKRGNFALAEKIIRREAELVHDRRMLGFTLSASEGHYREEAPPAINAQVDFWNRMEFIVEGLNRGEAPSVEVIETAYDLREKAFLK